MLTHELHVNGQITHQPGLKTVIVEVLHVRNTRGSTLLILRRVEFGNKQRFRPGV